ncbi:hypothetical protein [Amycolatopsis balhimycina]|nr:hypothetical protein [Amycolatopsis balhimycina]
MDKIEIFRAGPAQAGVLTALMHASPAYQGEYASIWMVTRSHPSTSKAT